ncbi:mitochondrial carrier domain-containing protein [Pelagophyceae sp. CCMP2097]|nr:mitochondrial carrier domain-containing protein [Pelagophyceae sp. CCMP2097]
MDLIKTRQQVGASRLSTAATARMLFQASGPSGLYRGFGWSTIINVPSDIVSYGSYTVVKRWLLATDWGAAHPAAVFSVAGFFTDGLASLMTVPSDNISQRLMVSNPHGGGVSGLALVKNVLRTEGALGFFRGSSISIFQGALGSGVWWLVHESTKQEVSRHWKKGAESPAVHAFCGLAAGVICTVATHPLDVVRTRLQCGEISVPLALVGRMLLHESGWRGLFFGIAPRIGAVVPRSILQALVYERAMAFAESPPTKKTPPPGAKTLEL